MVIVVLSDGHIIFNSVLYLNRSHVYLLLCYYGFILTLFLYSHADNRRSIPSVVDGLKPSQRKVLFACFKRKLDKQSSGEVKVAQLAGEVSS